MPTVNLNPQEILHMDGNQGAYVVYLPPGEDGIGAQLVCANAVPVDVSVHADGTDQIRDITTGGGVSTYRGVMIRESLYIIFDANSGQWFIVSASMDAITEWETSDLLPISIPAGTGPGLPVVVPLQYLAGDTELVTTNISGHLVAGYTLFSEVIDLTAAIYSEGLVTVNNTGGNVVYAWELVQGTGVVRSIDDGHGVQSSRTFVQVAKMQPQAIWLPVAGDEVRLVAFLLDADPSFAGRISGLAATSISRVQ